ncbi:MAG: hypothetical protein SCK70_04005 [bacterium]|nr:hypothetical protein [bacterium]
MSQVSQIPVIVKQPKLLYQAYYLKAIQHTAYAEQFILSKESDITRQVKIDRCPKCQIGTMRAIGIERDSKVRNWHAYIGCS